MLGAAVLAPAPAQADQVRMRDAPRELIPVLDASMRPPTGGPRAACLAATRRAEQIHGLPRGLLTAIALSESGLHAHALSIGGRPHFPNELAQARRLLRGAPARSSVMAGCMQVNARVHARGEDWPLDPFIAADWAGGVLARWARETGSWPEALRRWHGASRNAARPLICRVRAKLEVTNPASPLFEDLRCNAAQASRLRQHATAHLQTAARQGGRQGREQTASASR